jgi:hypothetical protein
VVGKICRHQTEITENDISVLRAKCFAEPWRLLWNIQQPKSDAPVAEWRKFATENLCLDVSLPQTLDKCKTAIKNWLAKYDMEESDVSMTEERLYAWNIIIENLRVRRIDTSILTAHGVVVPGAFHTCLFSMKRWQLMNVFSGRHREALKSFG